MKLRSIFSDKTASVGLNFTWLKGELIRHWTRSISIRFLICEMFQTTTMMMNRKCGWKKRYSLVRHGEYSWYSLKLFLAMKQVPTGSLRSAFLGLCWWYTYLGAHAWNGRRKKTRSETLFNQQHKEVTGASSQRNVQFQRLVKDLQNFRWVLSAHSFTFWRMLFLSHIEFCPKTDFQPFSLERNSKSIANKASTTFADNK